MFTTDVVLSEDRGFRTLMQLIPSVGDGRTLRSRLPGHTQQAAVRSEDAVMSQPPFPFLSLLLWVPLLWPPRGIWPVFDFLPPSSLTCAFTILLSSIFSQRRVGSRGGEIAGAPALGAWRVSGKVRKLLQCPWQTVPWWLVT